MENIVDYLKQLDLSDAEAKLYLTLLQTGPIRVRELAQTVDIKRTTAYFYIDELIEKGLIMKLVRGSKKLVAASDPENLKILVEKKIQKANEVQNAFQGILNTLHTSLSKESSTTRDEIRYYSGKSGVKKIYEEALLGSELRLYLSLSEVAPLFPENDYLFENALNSNKNLQIFEIYGDKHTNIKELSYNVKSTRYYYKFLPSNVHLTAACILIYDTNKVAIINVSKIDNISGIVLYSKDYYNNSKELFDFMWHSLPETI
jgi:sugar-specific transcriptional regulator TrmB